jgi:hypothetical protein
MMRIRDLALILAAAVVLIGLYADMQRTDAESACREQMTTCEAPP